MPEVLVAQGTPGNLVATFAKGLRPCRGILIVITVCAFTILGERLADPGSAPDLR